MVTIVPPRRDAGFRRRRSSRSRAGDRPLAPFVTVKLVRIQARTQNGRESSVSRAVAADIADPRLGLRSVPSTRSRPGRSPGGAFVWPTCAIAGGKGGLRRWAARLRSGSGSAKEFGRPSQVIDPPLVLEDPTTRQVASSARRTLIVLPPRAAKDRRSRCNAAPLELDWMFACASTTPPPETAMALHSVGLSASIENGNVRFMGIRRDSEGADRPDARPMMPPKIDGRCAEIWTSMNRGARHSDRGSAGM